MPRKVERLAGDALTSPVRITVGEVGGANEDIKQVGSAACKMVQGPGSCVAAIHHGRSWGVNACSSIRPAARLPTELNHLLAATSLKQSAARCGHGAEVAAACQ